MVGVAPALPPLRVRKDLRPSLLAGLLSLRQSLCRLHHLSLRPLLLPQRTGHQGHPLEQNRQHYQAISAVDDQETLIIKIIIKGPIISHVICISMLIKTFESLCLVVSLIP